MQLSKKLTKTTNDNKLIYASNMYYTAILVDASKENNEMIATRKPSSTYKIKQWSMFKASNERVFQLIDGQCCMSNHLF